VFEAEKIVDGHASRWNCNKMLLRDAEKVVALLAAMNWIDGLRMRQEIVRLCHNEVGSMTYEPTLNSPRLYKETGATFNKLCLKD
jgi:hypothetical protein